MEWFFRESDRNRNSRNYTNYLRTFGKKIYKIDRAEKIIQSATKQSNQYYLPKINEAITLSEFIKKNHDGQKFIAHCEESDKKSFAKEIEKRPTCNRY